MVKRPRIRHIHSAYKHLNDAKVVDYEFGDWRDFFVAPEDKLKVFNSLKIYEFRITIQQDMVQYIIKDIPDVKKIKIFIPQRPPKNTYYCLASADTAQYFRFEKIEMTDFGYHVTLYRR